MAVEEQANGSGGGGSEHDLLGRTGCPVWLKPERFLEADFNPEACVADLRRYVPLATLQNELSSYLATLKTKLVEVINEDYADYVGLSGRLANVEGSVLRMRKPLLELRDKLHAVQEVVRTELMSLNQGLRRRKEVATQRALLELILEVSHVAAKVEKLLEEVAAAEANAAAASGAAADGAAASHSALSESELVSQCRLLERVAAEVSRLAFLANKGKDLAFVRSLAPRISAHRTALSGRLSSCLSAALASGNTPAAVHALHAAADLGETAPAEAAVRTVVVGPLVEKLIAEHKSHSTAAGSASGSGLPALLSSLLVGVRQRLGPLLDATLAPGSALRSIDLLSNAVLDEVQAALAAAMPGVFSPGVPPAFHANYLATTSWLRQLEGLCSTRGAVERLRASPAHAALMRRWNTSVYFSLLYQEIAGELEDALSGDRLEPSPGSTLEPPLQLAASCVMLRCLARAASPDVVLPPLTDRFLRLALQLSQRYATWLGALAQARRDAAASAAAPPAAGAAAAGTPPPAGAAGVAGTGAGPAVAAAAGPMAWVGSLPAEELMAAVHDAEAVSEAVRTSYTASFLELLPAPQPTNPTPGAGPDAAAAANPSAVVSAVRAALAEAAGGLSGCGRSLAAVVTDEVVERCVAVVRQLKGITATYRMTSKGPPTRASHYVGGVLAPLRQLLDSATVRRLAPHLQKELLVLPVAEGVCSRYAALAEDLLVSVRKTESSLKRLKKAKGQGAGEDGADPAAAMSDSDKITLQLHLDVAELGQQLARGFGLADPAAELPSFRRLTEVVAPPPGVTVGGGAPVPTAAAAAPASVVQAQVVPMAGAAGGVGGAGPRWSGGGAGEGPVGGARVSGGGAARVSQGGEEDGLL